MTSLTIIVLYLGLLVGVGIASAFFFRGTSKDFFVVSRSLGPVLLLLSVFGTTMTAFGLVGSSGGAFREGIAVYGKVASWSTLLHSAVFFFIGMRLWALGKRHGLTTQIQFFRKRFESEALGFLLFPVLVGFVFPYLLVGILGAGATIAGVTRGAFPEVFTQTAGAVPAGLGSGIICLVVMSYVFSGGMRSAAWANAVQTSLFLLMGVVAFWVISERLGGVGKAIALVDKSKLVREGNVGIGEYWTYCWIPLSVAMFPHLFQHWLTARSAKAFRLTLVFHPLFILITWIPCTLIGLWATHAIGFDGLLIVPKGTDPNEVLGLMVGALAPPVITGLVAAGILAAIMSSLDSQFVVLGTMFTHDIVLPLWGGERRFSDRQILGLARSFMVFMMALAWLVSLKAPRDIFALGVWCFSGLGGLSPLIVGALYWRRATAWGAMASVVAVVVTWSLFFFMSYLYGQGDTGDVMLSGLHPAFYIAGAGAISLAIGSWMTAPPSEECLQQFFSQEKEEGC